MPFKKKNFAKSVITNNPLANNGTSLTVTTSDGAKFGDTGSNNVFRGVLWGASYATPEADANREVVEAYRSSGDTFTIVRGKEGTTGVEWAQGSNFMLTATGEVFEDLEFWKNVPGTPTRVSNTQFTITDTANASGFQNLFSKGIVLKWTDSGTKQAMVTSSSYATNVVTINIMGDTLGAGFSAMKYCLEKAKEVQFVVIGTQAVGTDLAGKFYAPYALKIFGADARCVTAPTGSALTFDINVGGTTVFTTKPSIAASGTSDLLNTADNGATATDGAEITVDVDAVGSTVAGVDAYIKLYVAPYINIYLS